MESVADLKTKVAKFEALIEAKLDRGEDVPDGLLSVLASYNNRLLAAMKQGEATSVGDASFFDSSAVETILATPAVARRSMSMSSLDTTPIATPIPRAISLETAPIAESATDSSNTLNGASEKSSLMTDMKAETAAKPCQPDIREACVTKETPVKAKAGECMLVQRDASLGAEELQLLQRSTYCADDMNEQYEDSIKLLGLRHGASTDYNYKQIIFVNGEEHFHCNGVAAGEVDKLLELARTIGDGKSVKPTDLLQHELVKDFLFQRCCYRGEDWARMVADCRLKFPGSTETAFASNIAFIVHLTIKVRNLLKNELEAKARKEKKMGIAPGALLVKSLSDLEEKQTTTSSWSKHAYSKESMRSSMDIYMKFLLGVFNTKFEPGSLEYQQHMGTMKMCVASKQGDCISMLEKEMQKKSVDRKVLQTHIECLLTLRSICATPEMTVLGFDNDSTHGLPKCLTDYPVIVLSFVAAIESTSVEKLVAGLLPALTKMLVLEAAFQKKMDFISAFKHIADAEDWVEDDAENRVNHLSLQEIKNVANILNSGGKTSKKEEEDRCIDRFMALLRLRLIEVAVDNAKLLQLITPIKGLQVNSALGKQMLLLSYCCVTVKQVLEREACHKLRQLKPRKSNKFLEHILGSATEHLQLQLLCLQLFYSLVEADEDFWKVVKLMPARSGVTPDVLSYLETTMKVSLPEWMATASTSERERDGLDVLQIRAVNVNGNEELARPGASKTNRNEIASANLEVMHGAIKSITDFKTYIATFNAQHRSKKLHLYSSTSSPDTDKLPVQVERKILPLKEKDKKQVHLTLFHKGDKVEYPVTSYVGLRKTEEGMYPGVVLANNKDGTYVVQFDDGDGYADCVWSAMYPSKENTADTLDRICKTLGIFDIQHTVDGKARSVMTFLMQHQPPIPSKTFSKNKADRKRKRAENDSNEGVASTPEAMTAQV